MSAHASLHIIDVFGYGQKEHSRRICYTKQVVCKKVMTMVFYFPMAILISFFPMDIPK